MIDAQTSCVAIFGNPVTQSLSPQMHNAAFNHVGLNMVYLAFNVKEAADAATAMRTLGLMGASITAPHKEAIAEHLDELNEICAAIGAVNTVVNQEGRLVGCNTDWLGVVQALEQVADLPGARCLVLGAGGGSRAAIYGLQRKGATVFIMNRNEVRARSLAAQMNCAFVHWGAWERLNVEFVINATSAGMTPNQGRSLVPKRWLKAGMVVLDMVYRPMETKLLKDAKAAGCRGVSGLEMLLYQGAAQFEIWTARKPPVEIMRKALVEALRDDADQGR